MVSQVKRPPTNVIEPRLAPGRDAQRRIIASTLELLEESNFEELAIGDITSRAGMAVGNFYRRFKGKAALLPVLYEEYDRIFMRWITTFSEIEAFQSPDAAVRLRALVVSVFGFFKDHRGLIRALHLNSRLNGQIVPAGSGPARQAIYTQFAELIDPDSRIEDREALAESMMLIILSTAVETILYPEQSPSANISVAPEAIIERLATAMVALVSVSGPNTNDASD
jgi:AcrR family transcriptional regulator